MMTYFRYTLRVLGLRTELYKTVLEVPIVAIMMVPNLKNSQDMIAADDMEKLKDNCRLI